jgi:hypothetical protein
MLFYKKILNPFLLFFQISRMKEILSEIFCNLLLKKYIIAPKNHMFLY